MSEALPIVRAPVKYPIINYTGVPWSPILCVVNRNESIVTSSGIIEFDPEILSLDTFNYYGRIGGSLSSISCNMTYCINVIVIAADTVKHIAFDDLIVADGYIVSNLLETLSLPKLKHTTVWNGMLIGSGIMTSFTSLPEFETAPSFFQLSMPVMTSCSMPKFRLVGNLILWTDMWANVGFPALENVNGTLEISDLACTSVSFPVLVNINSDINFQVPLCTSISLPSIKKIGSNNMYIYGSLPTAEVDAFLAMLVSLDGTNGTILFQNTHVDISAGNQPPSLAGQTSVATLRGRGCTVITN